MRSPIILFESDAFELSEWVGDLTADVAKLKSDLEKKYSHWSWQLELNGVVQSKRGFSTR